MTTTTKTLNDVNLAAVGGLVSAIRDDPATAETVWKATVDWKGGFRSEARSRDFAPVSSDEPEALGGDDTAPNPVDSFSERWATAWQSGMTNASAAGVELKKLRIELEGDLDLHTFLGLADGHAGYETIKASVTIESDATVETIRELHNKVVATSPVGPRTATGCPGQR